MTCKLANDRKTIQTSRETSAFTYTLSKIFISISLNRKTQGLVVDDKQKSILMRIFEKLSRSLVISS